MKNSFKIALYVVLTPIGLVLALVLLLAVYIFARSGDIAPIDDSDLRVEEQVVADEDNMLVALLSVTNRLTVSKEDALLCSAYRNYRRNGRGLPSRDYPDMQVVTSTIDRVLSDNAAYFEGLHVAASCPSYKFTESSAQVIPPVWVLGQTSKMLSLKALREIERKEHDAAFQTICDLSAIGSLVRGNSYAMVDLLAGSGIDGIALTSARELACAEGVSDRILVALSDLLKERMDEKALIELALKREYCNWTLPAIKRLSDPAGLWPFDGPCRDEERGMGAVILSSLRRVPFVWRYMYKPETTRQACAESVRRMLKGGVREPLEKASVFRPNYVGNGVKRTLLSIEDCVSGERKRIPVGLAFLSLTIAAQRYRRAHDGAYPPDLEALVPEFLPSVPEDPFAPGHPLNYDAKTLYVWSVGPEGSFNPRPERKIHDLGRHRYNLLDWSVRLDGKIPGEEFRKKEPIKRKARQD